MGLFFNAEAIEAEFNGHVVEGFSEDEDAIMFPDIELAQVQRGADGKMMALSTANRGGEVRIKLLPNSRSTAFFSQQAMVQKQGGRVVWEMNVSYPQAGITVAGRRGVMKEAPFGQTVGKGAAAAREFLFEFESLDSNYDGANFTGVPPAPNK